MARVLQYPLCRCSFHLLCLPSGFIKLGMMQSQFIVPIAYLPDKHLSSGIDRKSTRLNSSHTEIYTLSLHDALPIFPPPMFAIRLHKTGNDAEPIYSAYCLSAR